MCSGASATCPVDGVRTAGTVCRAAVAPCDADDLCNGSSDECVDVRRPRGTLCRAVQRGDDGATCDVLDVCDGLSVTCDIDRVAMRGTSCRANATTLDDECRAVRTCDGQTWVRVLLLSLCVK